MIHQDDTTKDSTYVTWADAFHPESAQASLAPEVRGQSHESRWGAVWAEATLVREATPSAAAHGLDVPLATVVEADYTANPEEDTMTPPALPPQDNNASASTTAASSDVLASTTPPTTTDRPWNKGTCLSSIVGGSLALGAVSAAFATDLGAAVVYLLAVTFFKLCQWIEKVSSDSCIFQAPLQLLRAIFLFVVSVLMMVDGILLSLSVLVTEILAVVALLVCTLFGGIAAGSTWHQFIRKMCLLTRWALRSFHEEWRPKRVFGWTNQAGYPYYCSGEAEEGAAAESDLPAARRAEQA